MQSISVFSCSLVDGNSANTPKVCLRTRTSQISVCPKSQLCFLPVFCLFEKSVDFCFFVFFCVFSLFSPPQTGKNTKNRKSTIFQTCKNTKNTKNTNRKWTKQANTPHLCFAAGHQPQNRGGVCFYAPMAQAPEAPGLQGPFAPGRQTPRSPSGQVPQNLQSTQSLLCPRASRSLEIYKVPRASRSLEIYKVPRALRIRAGASKFTKYPGPPGPHAPLAPKTLQGMCLLPGPRLHQPKPHAPL